MLAEYSASPTPNSHASSKKAMQRSDEKKRLARHAQPGGILSEARRGGSY
jgi:hypothetical protein